MKIKKNLGKLFLSLFIFFFGFLLMDDITEPIEVVAASNVSGCCRYTGTNPGEAQPGVPVNSCTIGTQSSSTCPEMVNMGGSTLYYHWTYPGYCSNKTSYNPGGICVDGIEPMATVDTGPAIPFKLQIPIPGWTNQPKEYSNETLALYIVEIYKFFVGALGVVAVVMIMIGGFRWLISGGSSDKVSSAKEMISNAVVGLVLGLVSYLLLYTLNPATTSFKSLQIPAVTPLTANGLPGRIGLYSDNYEWYGEDSTPVWYSATATALDKVAINLKTDNLKLHIVSGSRTQAQAQKIYKQYCDDNPSCNDCYLACNPNPDCGKNCSHSNAVDIKLNKYNSDQQRILFDALKENGFCKFEKEANHFEYDDPNMPRKSSPCTDNY